MQDKFGMHCFVSGRVQGVWFRAHTNEEAKRLGVTGWVCNLADGRVEVMAWGDKDKVMQLFAWLKKGPERAEVQDVSFEEIAWEEHDDFSIT